MTTAMGRLTGNLVKSVQQAARRENLPQLIQNLNTLYRDAMDFYNSMPHQSAVPITEDKLVLPPALIEIASLYPEIAETIRRRYTTGYAQNPEHGLTGAVLYSLSLLYLSSKVPTLVSRNNEFLIIKNRTSQEFWKYFLAHIPEGNRLQMLCEDSCLTPDMLLLFMSQTDTQYYKVFCREFKKQNPEAYEKHHISIKELKQKKHKLFSL